MKRAILALIGTLLAALAFGAEPVTQPETLEKDTSGLLLLVLDQRPMGFVFVSKTGQILPESTTACQANEACTKLVQKLIDAGRVTTVQLSSDTPRSPIT